MQTALIVDLNFGTRNNEMKKLLTKNSLSVQRAPDEKRADYVYPGQSTPAAESTFQRKTLQRTQTPKKLEPLLVKSRIRIPMKTKSVDDLSFTTIAARSSFSILSSSAHLRRPRELIRASSGDGSDLLENGQPRRDFVRKRPSPRSPESELDTPSQHNKPIASSLSFRRKRRNRRKGFLYVLRSRKTVHRLFVILFMLFVMSFSIAFLKSKHNKDSGTYTTQSLSFFGSKAKTRQLASFPSLFGKLLLSRQATYPQGTLYDKPPVKISSRLRGADAASIDRLPRTSILFLPPPIDAAPGDLVHQVKPNLSPPPAKAPAVRRRYIFSASNNANIDEQKKFIAAEKHQLVVPVDMPRALRGSENKKDNDAGFFKRYTEGAPECTEVVDPAEVTFTLVTQLSLNRLWMMEQHCARWKHDISVAVYLGKDATETSVTLHNQLVNMGCSEQINVQTVTGFTDEEYPVNVLRNKALSVVNTSHVVYVDVDFWTSVDLFDHLQHHQMLLASDPKLTLVLPAFQLNRQCSGERDCRKVNIPQMPLSKEELIDRMMEHKATAFDPYNPGGHSSTRYREWLVQKDDELIPIECVNSNRYEPYLVFRYCHDLPPFQDAFTGYGKNKMTWVMQLRRYGYKLFQIGGAFVVHYPHLESTARLHWNGGANGELLQKPNHSLVNLSAYKRGQIDETFVKFRTWLAQNVADETVVPQCDISLNDDERLWINLTLVA